MNADGTLDESFTAEVGRSDAFVPNAWSLAVQTDGKILALGAFPIVSPNGAARIARFNPDGSHDPTFALPSPPMIVNQGNQYEGNIQAMALGPDDTLYVGGEFNRMGKLPRAGIVRVNLGAVEAEVLITAAFISGTVEFTMGIRTQINQIYRVETSDYLVNWTLLREVTGVREVTEFSDNGLPAESNKFYRVVLKPKP